MKKVSNNKIAQHQFNSKPVYNKHRTSSHVTQTSQLLDLSLFFSVSTPFSQNSTWTPGNVTILRRRSTYFLSRRSTRPLSKDSNSAKGPLSLRAQSTIATEVSHTPCSGLHATVIKKTQAVACTTRVPHITPRCKVTCSWNRSLCASTVASLHVVTCPLLPERQHSSLKAAPADACKLISIAQ